jgi:hypothetical protein
MEGVNGLVALAAINFSKTIQRPIYIERPMGDKVPCSTKTNVMGRGTEVSSVSGSRLLRLWGHNHPSLEIIVDCDTERSAFHGQ